MLWRTFTALGLILLAACGGSGSNNGSAGGQQALSDSLSQRGEGKTLVLIGQATEPAVIRSMEDYVNNVGPTPAGFVFYLILSGDVQRTRDELATMSAFMDRYPGTVMQLALGYGAEITGNLKESLFLLAGGFDEELQAVAEWLKSMEHAAMLRPLYEFDRACATYGPPEIYKPAFRYIVDAMRTAGVTNTRYVWQSTGPGYRLDNAGFNMNMGGLSNQLGGALDPLLEMESSTPRLNFCPISNFYPGDGYVDYFAISYWGEGGLAGQGTDISRAIYQQETRNILDEARRLGLELMIAESTPAFVGTTSGDLSVQWVHDYFDLIEEYDIRAFSYIASEWFDEGGNWGSIMFNGFFPPDARIHADEQVLAAWRERLANPRYINLGDTDLPGFLDVTITAEPLPWEGVAEEPRPMMRWPNCPFPLLPGTGGWCLPLIPGL